MGCVNGSRGSSFRGFTLVELLVVIADHRRVGGAVAASGSSCARIVADAVCQQPQADRAGLSKITTIPLARLPSAGNGTTGNRPTDRREWGWAYESWPFIEQRPLFDNTNDTLVRSTILKAYVCPNARPSCSTARRGRTMPATAAHG